MLDLLGDGLPTVARTNARPEAAALVEVLLTLRAHPMVAWAERMNSGDAHIGGRFVRFGWIGCPYVLGEFIKPTAKESCKSSVAASVHDALRSIGRPSAAPG